MVLDCAFKVLLSGQSLSFFLRVMPIYFHGNSEFLEIFLFFQAFYNDAAEPRQGVN